MSVRGGMARIGLSAATAVVGVVGMSASPASAAGVNGKLAYVDGDEFFDAYTMNPDGSRQTPLTASNGFVDSVTWSPDGTKVVYTLYTEGSDSGIWVRNADGSNAHRIADDNSLDPVWSPDSAKIAYERYLETDTTSADSIRVVKADGSETATLLTVTGDGNYVENPVWSPDGTKIAISRSVNDSYRVQVIPSTTATPNNSTATTIAQNGAFPQWSPDGTKISFERYNASGGSNLFVVAANASSAATPLTSSSGDEEVSHARWSPDGTKILYTKYTYRESTDDYLGVIMVMNSSDGSGKATLVQSGNHSADEAVWSPDGTKIAYELVYIFDGNSANEGIWVMNADGSGGVHVSSGYVPDWGTAPVDPAPAGGALVPLTPARILDTRNGIGASQVQVGSGKTVTLQVTGRGGVPIASSVSAAVLNVTATRGTAGGYVTVYPDGISRPNTSNVAFAARQTIATHVTVKTGANGRVVLFNGSSKPVDLIADVSGWYSAGTVTEEGMFTPVNPARLANGAATAAGATRAVQVTGQASIPTSDVAAGAFNITVSAPAKPGYITAYPNGSPRPNASNVNFLTGQTIANAATSQLGTDGAVGLFNGSAGGTRISADVAGWFRSGDADTAGAFTSLTPARILDTRNAIGAAKAQVGAGKTVTLTVAGAGGVPSTGAGAAVLNVTVTRGRAGGYVTAYPTAAVRPNASNVNFVAGQTVPNLVTVKLGGGKVTFYNGSTQPVDVIADVAGWYRG